MSLIGGKSTLNLGISQISRKKKVILHPNKNNYARKATNSSTIRPGWGGV